MEKRGRKQWNIEIVVLLLAAAVLFIFQRKDVGFERILTAEAATCPISDGGVGDDDASTNGVVTISSSTTFAAVTGSYDCTATPFVITGTGTLILDGNPATGQIAQVTFGTLTVNSGGIIHADFKGCLSGPNYSRVPGGSNVCADDTSVTVYGNGAGGAGHGGAGGAGSTSVGRGTYGSATAPVLFGASGGSTNQAISNGGNGGGVVRIVVTGVMTHNGTISADGGNGLINGANAAGGGAGGSINITAGTINGTTGTFGARGGNGGNSTNDGGGGGGGRIAVFHGGGSFAFDAGDFDVAGGAVTDSATAGVKGTVFVKDTAANAVTTFLGFSYDNTNHFVSTWTTDPSTTNQYCEPGASTPAIHATGAIVMAGTMNCTTAISSFTVESSTSLAFSNSASYSVNGSMFLSAGNVFSIGTGVSIATTAINGDLEFNVPPGDDQTWDGLTVTVGAEGEFIADDAFGLTLTNGTQINGSVRWTRLTTLTDTSDVSINANARGCFQSANYSSVPNGSNACSTDTGVSIFGSGAGGAGHGGPGGPGSTSVGRGTYDSAIAPVLFGASGGSTNQSIFNGGTGGGTVRIVVSGAFTHNGSISADGGNGATGVSGFAAGGGAGGSVYITSGSLGGTTGTFSAKGGNGFNNTNDGGGGGGGRIAIYHTAGSFAFDAGDFDVSGGTATGTATAGTKGTVYVKNTATNGVSVFHGFSFDNTNHFVSGWTTDPTATNQYCEPGAVTPSIRSTGAVTLAGVMSCTATISSFTVDAAALLTVANSTSLLINGAIFFTGGTGLSMGTGVAITNTRVDHNIEFNIGAGSSTTWDSLTLTVAPEGEFITDDAFNLTLQSGTTINGSVRWTNLASFTQNAGTAINANARGCVASTNYSSTPNGSNVCSTDTGVSTYGPGSGGAGHGGSGGAGSTSVARGVYGSAIAPVLFGTSGGSTNQGVVNGGYGGGAVRISVAGTFTHNGAISADGGNGAILGANASAGGSGGSVYITAGTLNGTTGTLSAGGGSGADSTQDGGGGGGGRISVSHGGGSFAFDAGDFDVSGGTATGSAAGGIKGTVYVRNTATNAVSVYHGFSFDNSNHFVSSWTTDASATNQYCESGTSTPTIRATGTITLAGTFNCSNAISLFTADAATTLTISNGSSHAANGSMLLSAGTAFSVGTGVAISTTAVNGDLTFNIPGGNSQTWDSLTVSIGPEGEFITDDVFSLTLQNGTQVNGNVRWTRLTDLTQNAGTSISANVKGCLPSTNYSNVPNGSNVCFTDTGVSTYGPGSGGAGHGGAGGAGSTSVGRGTYDSAIAPVLFGASGGSTNQGVSNGGVGGGVVRIGVSGTFTHDGTISANGGNGAILGANASGGGAGGSVYVTAGTYSCSTGTFAAGGGNGADSTQDGGGGGGGRFSIEYGTDASGACPLSGLTAVAVVPGGTATGSAVAGATGTINLTTPVPTPGACPFVDNDAGDNDPAVGVYEWNSNQTFAAQSTNYDCTSPALFRIAAGRTITLDGNSTTGFYAKVDFTDLIIDATGKLTADSEGCAGGPNHVRFPNSSNVCVDHGGVTYGIGSSGGGHGGVGGTGSTVPTSGGTYGSATAPVQYGSAGGGNNAGTNGVAGGGVVKVTVGGVLTHNGTISANGNNGVISGTTGTGGGSGGSIYISAGTINGTTGLFQAKGGNGADSTNDGGGGGGGRIAVYYNATGSAFAFTSANVDVAGGAAVGTAVAGTKGTVFIDDDNSTKGTTIDDDVTIFHGFTFTDADIAVNSWTADVSASDQYCDPAISSGATPSISALTITHDGTLNCSQTVSTFGFFSSGNMSFVSGSQFTVNAALSLSAGGTFSLGTGVTISQNKVNAGIDFNIPTGNDQTWSGLTVNGSAGGDFTIDDAAAITLSSGTALNASLRFTNLTSFTQDVGTTINAGGKGCAGGPNHVRFPNSSNVCVDHGGVTYGVGPSGGGHGGVGGTGSTVPTSGGTYGSATAPVLYGSAGGGNNAGTNGVAGGGLIRINASGAVVLNGTVSANGNNGVISGTTGTGGGAGGSIYISTTGALSGSIATIFARGGNGADSTNDGGGGGGGRISLVYASTSLTLASGLFDVSGGTATGTAVAGGKGTVFTQDMAGTPNGTGDDTIRIYHGFTFADVDFSLTAWIADASATNQYCDTTSSTPSVSAETISLNGATNCTVAISSLTYSANTTLTLVAGASTAVNGQQTLSAGTTLTLGNGSSVGSVGRLSLSATGAFVMGSSVTVTNSGTNTDIDFNIPTGNDQTWSGLTVNGPAEGDFVIDDAVAIALSSGTALNASLRFTNLTSFTQDVGTTINAGGKGCAGGPNHVMIPNSSNVCGNHGGTTYGVGSSGGGHGGAGGPGSTAPTSGGTYGSATAPVLYGSAGGGNNAGTNGVAGGGLIRINASGAVVLNGTVSANGNNGVISGTTGTGGGAGGSIYISTTGALSGSIATIFARGGNGADSTNDGGGGGGGRISLVYASTSLTLASGLFDVSGGTATGTAVAGGKGTVFTDEIGTNRFVFNDDDIRVYHGFMYTDYDWVVNSWIIEPGAVQYCDTTMGTSASPSVTATNAITFNGTLNCAPSATRISSFAWSSPSGFSMSASTTMSIKGQLFMTSSAGPITIGNGATISTTTTDAGFGGIFLSGNTAFTLGTGISMTATAENSDIDFNIPAGNNQTWSGLTLTTPAEGDLTVDDAVAITLASGTVINGNVRFTNLTAFTQDVGTTINASGKGCAGSAAHAVSPNSSNICSLNNNAFGAGAGGGGHGGPGGAGSTVSAPGTYGSATAPVLYGMSGGGGNSSPIGANAGGLIRINASGAVTLNGTIAADGSNGGISGANAAGGGSGGSIYISTTDGLSGSIVSFSANGGDGANSTQDGGGGGGGRISLVYGSTTLSLAAGLFDVSGGAATGTAVSGTKGTVYTDDTNGNTPITTDDTVRIFHGFTFADVDHSVSQWIIDASATNQYCDTTLGTGATPSVTATNAVTFNGTLNCAPSATRIASFTWSSPSGVTMSASTTMNVKGSLTMTTSAGPISIGNNATIGTTTTDSGFGGISLSGATTFSIGTGVTVSAAAVNSDINFNIPAGNNQTWSGLTLTTPAEGDLTVDDAVAITLASGTVINGNVRFTNLTAFTQDVGTTINASGKGCAGGPNHAVSPNSSNICSLNNNAFGAGAGGGGHGGPGGAGSTVSAPGTYGSATAPVLYGMSGGGGNSSPIGANAGGLIRINASGAVTLNGTIAADGSNGGISGANAAGGGSGGSIYVTAGTLAGTPAVPYSAKGGNGGNSTNDGGGGGGGRMSFVYSTTTQSLTSASFNVDGGTATPTGVAGQKGTVYASEGSTNAVRIFHGFTFADVDHSVSQWIIDASATNQYCDTTLGTGATPSVTATNAITFNGTLNCAPSATRIASFTWSSPSGVTMSASTTMNVKGSLTMTTSAGAIAIGNNATIGTTTTDSGFGGISLSGATTFSIGTGVTVSAAAVNSDINFNIPAGNNQTWDDLTVNGPPEGDFIVDDNVAIVLQNTSAINANVRWTNLTDLTQNSGNPIDASGKGCAGGPNHAISPNSSNICSLNNNAFGAGAGGGGHGGAGGAGSTTAGAGTYDSAANPVLYGMSGGGGNSSPVGPNAGGLVRIIASGTFTHDGTITADGLNGGISGANAAGGAAGGTVNVSTSTYTCSTGTFSAKGGDGGNSTQKGGGGGGGRAAISYNTDASGGCPLSGLTAVGVVPGGTATPTGVAGSTGSLTLNAGNPIPAITTISPTSRAVGSGTFTLTVNGSNFVGTSVVRFNGSDRTTTFVSATQVTASIPASDQTTAGSNNITVFNPTPAGGESNAVTFDVTNPAPTTTSISPNNKNVGEGAFTMTVNGTNFVTSSVVRFDGSDRTTTFVNATQVTASIPASDMLVGGNFTITVFNPTPGGGTSNGQTFTVGNPIPTTTSISPASKIAGEGDFIMTVNGTGFVSSSVVRLDGSDRTTTFVNSTQLTADIPASDMTTAGTFTITVFNPAPGGGTSNGQTFTVNNPVPTTTGIIPSTKNVGDGAFTMTVEGTDFVPTSVVRFNGSDRTTTFVSSVQLTAAIPSTDNAVSGNFTITVFNPTPGGGTSNGQTFTVGSPVPTTTSISPTSRPANSGAFTLTVNGTNFTTGSVVRFAGQDKSTNFVNSSQVTASIPNSDLAVSGTFSVAVFNPSPGGGLSNSQTFTVENPVPTTTSISPTHKDVGSPDFVLTVNGTNFIASSVVRFAGSDRTTTFVSATQLTADIPASDLTTSGTFSITVFNPTPGGGVSNGQNFIVGNPVPVTTSISPASKTLGDSGFTMTVNGSDFAAAAVVRFAGSDRTTTFVSDTQLTADILTSDLTTAGTFSITVFNPTPVGGVSNGQTFTVNNPAPTTTGISPTSKDVGDVGFTMTVDGTNFLSSSVVRFNGSNRTTTFVNATQLTAAIPTSDMTTAGIFTITVFNPTPGGGVSNGQTFTVNNLAPTTSSIAPSSRAVGSGTFTLTVNGNNFVSNSVVRFEGSDRATTFVAATQLTATIPASDQTTIGTFNITVFNPAPGGGTSNAQVFTVGSADNPVPTTTSISPTSASHNGPGLTVTVNGTNFVTNSIVRFNGGDRGTTYVSANQLTAEIPSSDLTALGSFPITVFNPLPGGGTSNSQTFTVESTTQTTGNKVTLSRLKVGVVSTVDIAFTLTGTLSTPLTVTFPAGFTVLSAATGGSPCLSGFGFTASTLTANKTGCTGPIIMTGATVQNPPTPGAYTISWVNDEPGSATVFITSDDQANVTAAIEPTITFNVGSQPAATACDSSFVGNGGSIPLGALTTSSVSTSDAGGIPHICTRLLTDASFGAAVAVKSLNASLKSASSVDAIGSATATLAAGTQGYGICVGSAGVDSGKTDPSGGPSSAAPARVAPFDGANCGSAGHDIGGLTTSFQNVWIVSGPSLNAFARIYVKASASGSTPAHNDYADTMTFIVTGTY